MSLATRQTPVSRPKPGVACVERPTATRSALGKAAHHLWPLAFLLGVYLTVEGYRSFEGDQAYRLPLLLHQQAARLYERDPFVRSFDAFNPHGGYLALLDRPSRVIGLPATLFLYFVATFAVTGLAIERLTRTVWPAAPAVVGWVAFACFLCTKAGNIGTNHLFEPMLLDRLMALALGWTALAELVVSPRRMPVTIPALLAAAQFVHPSLGLQLAALIAASLCGFMIFPSWVGARRALCLATLSLLVLVLIPTLAAIPAQSARLFTGLPIDQFVTIAAYVQSPQHMVPHLWRLPQWLAWLTFVGMGARYGWHVARQNAVETVGGRTRRRLGVVLAVALCALAAAWFAIEVRHDPRVTLFQPFRLATVVRGLCIVLLAEHGLALWRRGTWDGRCRALALLIALTSDWSLVWVGSIELLAREWERRGTSPRMVKALLLVGWVLSIWFMMRNDTEAGHVRLGLAVIAGLCSAAITAARTRRGPRNRWATQHDGATTLGAALDAPRRIRLLAYANMLPVIALLLTCAPPGLPDSWQTWVLRHIRLSEQPTEDLERLAVWCRAHTVADAVFVTPPGPKSFRLWSRRAVAFNRAASPYHAEGLKDWAARFCLHAGIAPSIERLSQEYLKNRHQLESRFERMSDERLAALAATQQARYVVASAGRGTEQRWLRPLHTEGAWSVYEVTESH